MRKGYLKDMTIEEMEKRLGNTEIFTPMMIEKLGLFSSSSILKAFKQKKINGTNPLKRTFLFQRKDLQEFLSKIIQKNEKIKEKIHQKNRFPTQTSYEEETIWIDMPKSVYEWLVNFGYSEKKFR